MKKNQNLNVEMYRVVDDLAPFVKVGYMDKNAEEHSGLMMLDSGSEKNYLTDEVARHFSNRKRRTNPKTRTMDCTGEVLPVDLAHFSFILGGIQFCDDFGVNRDINFGCVGDIPIIGLLGVKFMQKHGLVIDYSNFTVHSSDLFITDLIQSECDFIFPMGIGLDYYGVPVLAIHKNGTNTDAVAVADTGSMANLISTQCISLCNIKCAYKDGEDSMSGLKGNSEKCKCADMQFDLLTLQKDGCYGSVSFQDSFMVIDHSIAEAHLFSEQLEQNIEGFIGSPFMAKQGWTLDFAEKVIYKRKC